MEMEHSLTGAKKKEKEPEVIEEELLIEKKSVTEEAAVNESETEQDEALEIDPMHNSIDDTLKLRAEERRKKLKEFNYKFQNNTSKIDEIEKEPAYKRMGITLEDENREDDTSRMSLGKDSNDENQLRSNNSFLHDNVD